MSKNHRETITDGSPARLIEKWAIVIIGTAILLFQLWAFMSLFAYRVTFEIRRAIQDTPIRREDHIINEYRYEVPKTTTPSWIPTSSR